MTPTTEHVGKMISDLMLDHDQACTNNDMPVYADGVTTIEEIGNVGLETPGEWSNLVLTLPTGERFAIRVTRID